MQEKNVQYSRKFERNGKVGIVAAGHPVTQSQFQMIPGRWIDL